jgi:hydrogenase nickel incorporation protein HypA/HybF
MHELSVTESILKIALENATANQAKKVTDIHLVIGQLASIVDDSVQFYWDFVSEDTICQNAKLHFTRIPAVMKCSDCLNEYSIQEKLFNCPNCSSYKTIIIKGEEFYVDSIEIEKDLE